MTQVTDQHIEKEIKGKGLTAPRVTPEYIERIISECHYFTAYDGIRSANMGVGDAWIAHKSTDLLTFCVLVLKNGFTVTGESACASPENFDAEIGRKIARQNAVNKIWQLEGYLLKQRLYEQSLSEPLPDDVESATLQRDQCVKINGIPFFLMGNVRAATGKGNTARAFENLSGVGVDNSEAEAECIDLEAADFSDALLWLKEGKRVCRAGWNGKGQFVEIWRMADRLSWPTGPNPSQHVPMKSCFVLVNAQGEAQPGWVPSMGDLMATDWQIYDGVIGADEQQAEYGE